MKKLVRIFLVPLIFFGTLLQAEVPNSENVTRLYVATFNRAPDAAGLNYWVQQSHLQLEQIAQSFFDQPETQEKYPAGTSGHEFVKAVYNNLFNRDPDSGGWAYWERELQSGRVLKPVFILAVINGAQDTQEYGLDRTILQNKKEVGLYFVQSGLNSVQWAKEVMADVTAESQSVADAKRLIDRWREKMIRKNSPLVLSVMTQLDDQFFENALASNALCTVGLSGLESTEVKVRVNTQHGVTEIIPVSVSIEKQEIMFKTPSDVRDGNLSIVGVMIRSDILYRTVSAKMPYLKSLAPDMVKTGGDVVLSGKNLPSVPVELIFEGQNSSFNLTVTPVGNQVTFTVPQGVGSGNIYLKIAQVCTNRLYLSVKRMINVEAVSAKNLVTDPSNISFVLGLEEHRLDVDYHTSLNVENKTIQYLQAMVTRADDETALLYSAVVLPEMTGSISIDANSTAVAWIFIGMGASATVPKKDLSVLYDDVRANSKVQAFADYIDSLQKTDFDAWATRSDETLKIKFQEALQSVIESVSANGLHAQLKERSISPDTVVVTQNPENNNIYADKEKLDRGSITIVNDTKLYLSVEVRSNHPERKGEIVGGYYHAANAVLTDGGTLIGPQQWGLLDIASEKKFMLGGEDSHLEIVTAGFLGETDKKKLSDSLRARVMLEGIAIPSLNMLLTTVIDMQIDKGYKPTHFVDAMRLMYVNGDFLKQLMTEVSTENSNFAAIVDTFVIKPVVNGLKGCFQPETSDICNATVGGLAKLIGISGSTEYVKNKIIFKMETSIGKSALKKTLVAIPVVGWIAEAAVFVYDRMPYISNASTFIKSSMDMKHNPKEINVDVDFPLEGEGFLTEDGNGPEVYFDIGGNRVDASSVSGSVNDLSAGFNMNELLAYGSSEPYLSVSNFGYAVFYPQWIRLVSEDDSKVYLDSVAPKRAMWGDTVTIRGCGWVPLNRVKVIFPSENGSTEGEIVSATIDEIRVRVPKEAVSGLVHVKTDIKDASFFLPIEDFSLSSASVYRLEDGKSFTVDGAGLGTTAHLYFVDTNGKRYEGSIGNITDTGIWVNEPPVNLPVGEVQVYVVLENGTESNRVTLVKSPKSPLVVPGDNTWFEQSLTVTMSQENGADIYYRLGDPNGNEVLYTNPVYLVADSMDLLDLYLYVFARVDINGTTYDSEQEEYGYHTCDEGEVIAHHDDGSPYCAEVDPAVSSDTIYTFDDWKLECPEGMVLEHSEEETEYGTIFERDYCVLGNQKKIIKEVLRDSNMIYRKNYYLLLEDYFLNNYYWSSVLVYEREEDETFYYVAKDVSGTWDSYYQKERKWFGDTLEEERLYTLKKNSDGSIIWVRTVSSEWYFDGTKKVEDYYIAKQDNDGYWRSHVTKEIYWYQNSIKKNETLFDVKQNDYGEWHKVITKVSTWYETGKKDESTTYISKKDAWGRWQGIQTYDMHWSENGLPVTETYTEPYKQSTGYWEPVLKEKKEWFIEGYYITETETTYEAKQEMGGNYEAGTWTAYPTRVYTRYSAGNTEEIHYDYRLNDQNIWEQFLLYMKTWYANSVSQREVSYELKQDSDMSWKRIKLYETTWYENDIKASERVYLVRQDMHGKWDGYIKSEKGWYDNSNQKQEIIYDIENNSDGTIVACMRSKIFWYENGTRKEETSYRTVENNGYWSSLPLAKYTYYSNGSLASEIIFKEIIRDGVTVAVVDSMQCWDASGHEVGCLE